MSTSLQRQYEDVQALRLALRQQARTALDRQGTMPTLLLWRDREGALHQISDQQLGEQPPEQILRRRQQMQSVSERPDFQAAIIGWLGSISLKAGGHTPALISAAAHRHHDGEWDAWWPVREVGGERYTLGEGEQEHPLGLAESLQTPAAAWLYGFNLLLPLLFFSLVLATTNEEYPWLRVLIYALIWSAISTARHRRYLLYGPMAFNAAMPLLAWVLANGLHLL